MYLVNRIVFVGLCMLFFNQAMAQEGAVNHTALEIGVHVAGDETLFYGANARYILPLSQKRHFPTLGLSLTMNFDLKGESEAGAYLKNDVDMRIIPAIHPGYSLNFNKVQLNFELPVGASIAITKGTLVNERIGFEREYENAEILWHYGLAFSPKYRLNTEHQIGLNTFFPLVPDKTWSGYLFGIGWTKTFVNKD